MQLPEDFIRSMCSFMGERLSEDLQKSLEEDPVISIRFNPFKVQISDVNDSNGRVGWCPLGYYLKKRFPFTFDPLMSAGAYYVQDASSMFLYHVLKEYVKESCIMLDLCASPGGKSTIALSALPFGSLLFSNEINSSRSQVLKENIQKFGVNNVIVTNNSAKDYKDAGIEFDVILADVPCSGEGMFRKDKEAVLGWSLQNVDRCQQLQREIISDIWSTLKDGGFFIYSTCTFNDKENEQNIEWLLSKYDAELLPVSVDKKWNITGSLTVDDMAVYRFLTCRTKGEGLFMAVLRKRSGEFRENKQLKNKKNIDFDLNAQWVNKNKKVNYRLLRDEVFAVNSEWKGLFDSIYDKLNIISAFTPIAWIKGKDFLPHPALALSNWLEELAEITVCEVDYKTAIDYLRRESIILSTDINKGFVVVSYKSMPLGFVKNLGNRANNLYPQSWKIRSGYMPEKEVKVINIE